MLYKSVTSLYISGMLENFSTWQTAVLSHNSVHTRSFHPPKMYSPVSTVQPGLVKATSSKWQSEVRVRALSVGQDLLNIYGPEFQFDVWPCYGPCWSEPLLSDSSGCYCGVCSPCHFLRVIRNTCGCPAEAIKTSQPLPHSLSLCPAAEVHAPGLADASLHQRPFDLFHLPLFYCLWGFSPIK